MFWGLQAFGCLPPGFASVTYQGSAHRQGSGYYSSLLFLCNNSVAMLGAPLGRVPEVACGKAWFARYVRCGCLYWGAGAWCSGTILLFVYVYETRSYGYEVSDFARGMCRAAAYLFR